MDLGQTKDGTEIAQRVVVVIIIVILVIIIG